MARWICNDNPGFRSITWGIVWTLTAHGYYGALVWERDANVSLPLEGFSYISHWRKEFPEAYNKHTNTQDTIPDHVCINVSTNQFNLRLPQSLKWDRHWIPQGNLTGSIHMTCRGKMIYTHTQTENNRAYISEKHSSKTWWAGEAGYVEQYSISISLQFFIFPMRRHQLEEYTGLLQYKLANNAEHHKKNLEFCFVCFLKKKKIVVAVRRLQWKWMRPTFRGIKSRNIKLIIVYKNVI